MKECIKVGLLGAGTVGSGVLTVLEENTAEIEKKVGVPIHVSKILVRDMKKAKELSEKYQLTDKIEDIVEDPEIDIVVELIGREHPAKEYIAAALEHKKNVVTANKDVLAKYGKELFPLAEENKVDFMFEASVGGGIPIIRPLKSCLAANKVTSVMGIVLRMLADKKITVNNTICDGGITPYQIPWLLTRFIAVKDFLLISMGKTGGFSLLEKVFATDEYSKEDLEYMAKVFRFISYKTIWRTFESCNNYRMPEGTIEYLGKLEYWYGDKERKERAKDLAYVKEHFLHVKFIEMKNMGHASMATLYPENMAERIMDLAK